MDEFACRCGTLYAAGGHRLAIVAMTGLFFFGCLPQFACAYLDPGTGSYLLQIAIAGIAGGLFVLRGAIRSFFGRIVRLFSRHRDGNGDLQPRN